MRIGYTKDFDKKVDKLKDVTAKQRLYELIIKLEKATTLHEIQNVATIKGSFGLFRIRIGDYRLIVEYWNGSLNILLIDYLKRNEKTYKGLR